MEQYDLIDRYIAEIGRNLPRKNRLDIEAEILSALEDILAERSQQSGQPVDESMIVEVLKAYGAPGKVAASYHSEHYLVSPHMFPSFLYVVQVVLPILAALALVRIGLNLGTIELTFEAVFESIFLTLAEFIGSAFSTLGFLALLFTLLERVLPDFQIDNQGWDPRKLPRATRRNRIEIGSTVVNLFASTIGIIVFNFFPHLVTLSYRSGGIWLVGTLPSSEPGAWSGTILSPAFFDYLPAMTILWGLTILLDLGLLVRGRWEGWSRWTALGLNVMGIALAVILLSAPALVDLNTGRLVTAGLIDSLTAGLLENLAGQGVIVALVIAIIAQGVDSFRLLLRLTGKGLTPALDKFAHL